MEDQKPTELRKESDRSLLSPSGKSEPADDDDDNSCDTFWPVRADVPLLFVVVAVGPVFKIQPNSLRNKEIVTPSNPCLLYTSPSPRDRTRSRMPSSA